MPVLPVRWTASRATPSRIRFEAASSLGAKCRSATAPSTRRWASSGQGARLSYVRSPASTCASTAERVEAGQAGSHGRRRVALDEDDVGAHASAQVGDPCGNQPGHVLRLLTGTHRGQLVVDREAECVQRVGQQLVVLAGRAEDGLEVLLSLAQPLDGREHLDRLGPRTDHRKDAGARLAAVAGRREGPVPRAPQTGHPLDESAMRPTRQVAVQESTHAGDSPFRAVGLRRRLPALVPARRAALGARPAGRPPHRPRARGRGAERRRRCARAPGGRGAAPRTGALRQDRLAVRRAHASAPAPCDVPAGAVLHVQGIAAAGGAHAGRDRRRPARRTARRVLAARHVLAARTDRRPAAPDRTTPARRGDRARPGHRRCPRRGALRAARAARATAVARPPPAVAR